MASVQLTPNLADVDPLVRTVRVGAAKTAGVLALDVGIPAALLIVGIGACVSGTATIGWLFIATAGGLLGGAVWRLGHDGRTLGAVTVDARIVHRTTGAAAGGSALRALASGRLALFDLRRGRDPLAPAITPFRVPDAVATGSTGRARPGGVPILLLDSGERVSLGTAVILGRAPSAPTDASADVYCWADLSRTLSKSHVRLEWDGEQAWVIDLGSTNGTFIRGDGPSMPLLPHQRTPVPTGVVLEVGDRTLTVRGAA